MLGAQFLRKLLAPPQRRYRDGQYAPSPKALEREGRKKRVERELRQFVTEQKKLVRAVAKAVQS